MNTHTDRWNELDRHLAAFAEDMWAFHIHIDEGHWDPRRVNALTAAIYTDLRQAQATWPDGRSVLARLTKLVREIVEIREDEHRLTSAPPHKAMHSYRTINDYHKASVKWLRSMAQIQERLEATGNKMFECCDEIRRRTSIDLRARLERGPS